MHIFLLASDLAIGIARIIFWGIVISIIVLGFIYLATLSSKKKNDIPDDI